MAKYAAELSPRAVEDIQTRSPDVAARILRKLRELEDSPFPRGDTIKHLKGFETPTYRLRIGDSRAVYRISGTVVVILRIIPRSELGRAAALAPGPDGAGAPCRPRYWTWAAL